MDDPRDLLPPPRETYQRRLTERERSRDAWARRATLLGIARLVVFMAVAVALWASWRAGTGWPWAPLVPLAALFAVLVAVQDRVVRRRDAAGRAVDFYREGLRRVEGRPSPRPGARFLDADHPYSGDLDVFGPASLFERIDTSRTRHGEDALARRLTSASPVPPDAAAVRRRQAAVRELVARLDLREALAEAGQAARESEGDHRRVIEWAAGPPILRHAGRLRVLALGMPAVLLALATATLLGAPSFAPWAWAAATLLVFAVTRGPAHAVTSRVDTPARVLGNYERITTIAEGEPFEAEALQEIRDGLAADGPIRASREIRRLRRVVAWTDALRNQLVAFAGIFLLWELHCALALEAWRLRCGEALGGWLDALGELEATASLAAYAYEHRDHAFPEILDNGRPSLEARGLGHPLISPEACVRNDVMLEGPGSLLLVSGSNMSGKSTMLRAVGVNAALAMAGSAACVSHLAMSPMALSVSMRVLDSLQQGTSHFLAELKRLKQVTDLADSGVSLLYLLDEVLHGTNSRERRLGVRGLVGHLLRLGAMGLITTHDLDLADLEQVHPGQVRNVHFADHLEGGRMRFDYRVQPGVASTTNALRLIREVGIPLQGIDDERS